MYISTLTLIMFIALTFAIAFAITFTIISFYIASKKKVHSKYHFAGLSDMRIDPDAKINKDEIFSKVDNESAKREWERANNQR